MTNTAPRTAQATEASRLAYARRRAQNAGELAKAIYTVRAAIALGILDDSEITVDPI
jgi:hypothetical protein